MVDWEPRDNMGWLAYLKLKRGKWVEVDSLPEWVHNAKKGQKRENGVRRSEETLTGESLEYRIEYTAPYDHHGKGVYYYARIKD